MFQSHPGRQTVAFHTPPVLVSRGCAAGTMEARGPLSRCFDYLDADNRFGEPTWERSERAMQELSLRMAMKKLGRPVSDLELFFAGDLLNQCVSSSYAARSHGVPYCGLYGACSSMGEGLILAAMALSGGFCSLAGVSASSHFCTAERQYRTPLEYGGQRTPTAQWTVTGSGSIILSCEGKGPVITCCTIGRVVDCGITDTNNMGAAMAPQASEVTP